MKECAIDWKNGAWIVDMINSFDLHGDGVLSFQEFHVMMFMNQHE